ncbi:MAG TPA: Fe-S cluster assembly scaffold protein NifU [Candidatus Brocadiia bacterium]|nr:Fe-S cluster assembly scaffold protein NifU [Candidatus Brocadiia bacterium]
MYSEKVLDHFTNPRNVGEVENPDGVGEVGNPVCGDMMKITIKVDAKDLRITDVKFKTLGCGAAIATSSITTEMAAGKTLEEALAITRQAVAEGLDGLPPNKLHCSNLAADGLHKAILDYLSKRPEVKINVPEAVIKRSQESEEHDHDHNHGEE